jgi:hypothetical protein
MVTGGGVPERPSGSRRRDAAASVPKPATGFSERVVLAIRARAGDGDPDDAVCEACGMWLGRHLGEVQRRLAWGGRDSSLPMVNTVLLCGSGLLRATGCCGRAAMCDPQFNAWGFWLRCSEDPAETPIQRHGVKRPGLTVWLAADGTYRSRPPSGRREQQQRTSLADLRHRAVAAVRNWPPLTEAPNGAVT